MCEGFETCFKDDLTGSSTVRLSVFGCFVAVCLKTYSRFYTCFLMMLKGFVKRFLEHVWTLFESEKRFWARVSRFPAVLLQAAMNVVTT